MTRKRRGKIEIFRMDRARRRRLNAIKNRVLKHHMQSAKVKNGSDSGRLKFRRYYRSEYGLLPEYSLVGGQYFYVLDGCDCQYLMRLKDGKFGYVAEIMHEASSYLHEEGIRILYHRDFRIIIDRDIENLGNILLPKPFNNYCRRVSAISCSVDRLIKFKLML